MNDRVEESAEEIGFERSCDVTIVTSEEMHLGSRIPCMDEESHDVLIDKHVDHNRVVKVDEYVVETSIEHEHVFQLLVAFEGGRTFRDCDGSLGSLEKAQERKIDVLTAVDP